MPHHSLLCTSCGCVRPGPSHARRFPDGLCRVVREVSR